MATLQSDTGLKQGIFSVPLLVLILGALSALGPLAIDMYLPGFPAMELDLQASPAAVQSTLAVYFLGLAAGQLFYGPLSDRWGRKRPLYFGLGLFCVASVGCVFAHNVSQLITLRLFQAIGGCAEMVIARAMVRDYFNGAQAARVYSLLILVMGLAPVLAPMTGGWLVTHWGWRTIFVVLGCAGAMCLAAVIWLLPESHPPEHRRSHNLSGMLRIYGSILRDWRFMSYALQCGLILAGLFSYIGGSPFVFMQLFGVSPQNYGYYFGVNALGLIAASQINGMMVRKQRPEKLLRWATWVALGASVVLALTVSTGAGGFVGMLIPLFVFLASFGFSAPNAAALSMVPYGATAGFASALLGMIQFLVSGVVAVLISIFHNGSAFPMVAGIGLSAACAFAISCSRSDD